MCLNGMIFMTVLNILHGELQHFLFAPPVSPESLPIWAVKIARPDFTQKRPETHKVICAKTVKREDITTWKVRRDVTTVPLGNIHLYWHKQSVSTVRRGGSKVQWAEESALNAPGGILTKPLDGQYVLHVR